jgi:outer membrane protein OmpA-like peptidoglycan-associated protein
MSPVTISWSSARILALACVAGLSGCALKPSTEASLQQADSRYQALRNDAEVLRSAPRDLIRAGESLARAERLAGYWGSGSDAQHYAYLSVRYSEIARAHADQDVSQQQLDKLDLERQRLQLELRESRLASVQQQGKWMEEQIMNLTVQDAERGLVLTLGDVLFDTGDAELKASANRTLLKLVQFLQLNPKRVVRVEGYTDNTGDAAFNLNLSRERAQAVADMLADLGIDDKRIQVQGYGDQYPVEANASERGRAVNRRVEVVFSDKAGVLGAQRR